MRDSRNTGEKGFALFIIAALFIAFALVASAMIDRTNTTLQLTLQQNTRQQLDRIAYGLVQYSLSHTGRYPCPADPSVATGAADFGESSTGCETTLPAGITILTGSSNQTISGMVPVVDLVPYGVQMGDVIDAWNNRIIYNVDRRLTPDGSGTATAGTRPTVTDSFTGTTTTFTEADFLVVSYGRDGIGAIPKTGTSVAIACSASAEPRKTNCDGDRVFISQPITVGPSVTSALYYDDLLAFYISAPPAAPGPSCSGSTTGGFCWYAGGDNESCDSVCSGHGGYDPATETYANASNANCIAVAEGVMGAGYFGGTISGTAPWPFGCFYGTTFGTYLYKGTVPSGSSDSGSWFNRFCACNN